MFDHYCQLIRKTENSFSGKLSLEGFYRCPEASPGRLPAETRRARRRPAETPGQAGWGGGASRRLPHSRVGALQGTTWGRDITSLPPASGSSHRREGRARPPAAGGEVGAGWGDAGHRPG